jgi:hypothetical protein
MQITALSEEKQDVLLQDIPEISNHIPIDLVLII